MNMDLQLDSWVKKKCLSPCKEPQTDFLLIQSVGYTFQSLSLLGSIIINKDNQCLLRLDKYSYMRNIVGFKPECLWGFRKTFKIKFSQYAQENHRRSSKESPHSGHCVQHLL
jgi:hypothetical protein